MKTRTTRSPLPSTTAALLLTAITAAAGCQSQTTSKPSNPALRPMQAPVNGTQADADRATLARFVGGWNFEGWSSDSSGTRTPVAGRAAGVIETEHFVLLDLQVTSGQLGERGGRKGGSMLLASEPGIGVTITAWGSASPSINRLIGRSEGNGSSFTFNEATTPPGAKRLSATISFETDDRFILTARDAASTSEVASYTFTRTAR